MKTISTVLEISRSNLVERVSGARSERRPRYNKAQDLEILPAIKAICTERPSYGYRRVAAILNRQRYTEQKPLLNHKRVYRLMRQNQLLLQKHTGRPSRTHEGKVVTLRSNLRWCSDTFTIRCFNGEKVEVAFCLDTCDREAISSVVTANATTGEMIRDLMAQSLEARFGMVARLPHSIEWLSDNGPPYIAHETRAFGSSLGFTMCNTPSYSPESNGVSEAFVKTFKRDYVYLHRLDNPKMVFEQLPGWFNDYNENAPHKGLRMKSPREFRRTFLTN